MRFLADENFDNRILRGVRREGVTMDVIRAQDTEIYQSEDSILLEWAAQHGLILLTHDISTIPKYAYERINAGKPMPGIIAVNQDMPIGEIIDDLLLILGASKESEYESLVVFLPITK